MARGINKVILIGNLGNDPEVRYMPSGAAVANFSVATSENWKDKQSGETKTRTEWHRVCCFNRLGEIAGEYLKKGAKIYIEGRLQTRKWQDANGQDRYTTEIIATEMEMLGSGGGANTNAFEPAYLSESAAPMSSSASSPSTSPASNLNEFDDDIPF